MTQGGWKKPEVVMAQAVLPKMVNPEEAALLKEWEQSGSPVGDLLADYPDASTWTYTRNGLQKTAWSILCEHGRWNELWTLLHHGIDATQYWMWDMRTKKGSDALGVMCWYLQDDHSTNMCPQMPAALFHLMRELVFLGCPVPSFQLVFGSNRGIHLLPTSWKPQIDAIETWPVPLPYIYERRRRRAILRA
jgi:hypothetical protein